MEIEQYVYDLTEAGESIVAYKMIAQNGGSVEICNLSATVLSWSLPVGDSKQMVDIASGRCVRGLRGLDVDNWGGVKFSEMLWESRVEVNRVVMSLSWESDGVGMMSEVVFDYDDDNSLEITYIACADSPYEVDLTHSMTFGGSVVVDGENMDDNIYNIRDAKRGILREAAKIDAAAQITVLTSQPHIYSAGDTFATVTAPTQVVDADERYIQKTVFRIKQ